MKRVISVLIGAVLLLCITGCAGEETPKTAENEGLLTEESLLGTYDVSYLGETGGGNRTVELRILNEKLTYVFNPSGDLNNECSFDRYDPETGTAVLEQSGENERSVFCEITFIETDGNVTFSGIYTVTQGGVTEESYTLSGEMIEKL